MSWWVWGIGLEEGVILIVVMGDRDRGKDRVIVGK